MAFARFGTPAPQIGTFEAKDLEFVKHNVEEKPKKFDRGNQRNENNEGDLVDNS